MSRGEKHSGDSVANVGAVWIVRHESASNSILGVFATEAEASEFAEERADDLHGDVIYSRFEVGYRYNRGLGFVSFGPED